MRSIILLVWTLAGGLTLGACAEMQMKSTDRPNRFPEIVAENLERRKLDLPSAFAGERNIVILAYRREQQRDVDTWFPYLSTLASERRDVGYYELPVLSGVWRPLDWWIDGGMRSGIPDVAQRSRTITLYTDKSAFRRAVGVPDRDEDIDILLVDRGGNILWRGTGRFDAAKAAQIDAVVRR